MHGFRLPSRAQIGALGLTVLLVGPALALAQSEGGLYVAEAGVRFEQAADDGLSRNAGGQRFFLLALPPQAGALTTGASRSAAAARQRVVDGGGVLLVCRRDIDSGAIDATSTLQVACETIAGTRLRRQATSAPHAA